MSSRTRKTLWIITIVLVSIVLTQELLLPDMAGSGGMIFSVAGLISLFVLSLLLGLGLSLFKRDGASTYLQRLETSILASFIACSFIAVLVFGFIMIKAKQNMAHVGRRINFQEARPASSCRDIREGVFEDENMVITRMGETQTQVYKKSDYTEEMRVRWTSECEYELTPERYNAPPIQVKVTRITPDGYICVARTDYEAYGREYVFKRSK